MRGNELPKLEFGCREVCSNRVEQKENCLLEQELSPMQY